MKTLFMLLLFFIYLSNEKYQTGGFSFPEECESYSSCSADDHGSELNIMDQSHWISEISQQSTLIPYSKIFYTYIFEPLFDNDQPNERNSAFFGFLLNKVTFAICLLVWSCILFIACGTVADTYISSLMIKLAECLSLSDTFAGSTLLAFSNAASDVILGIISVSIGEKDAVDVFLGDVIGACLFIILVVFGCVMVFSKSSENSNYINIPIFNHLRDTIALTIGLIQLLIIHHLGFISSKMSVIPLIAYGFYVLLLQWSEKSTSLSMPVNLTIKEEYVGPVYEQVTDSDEVRGGSKLSLRNVAITSDIPNYRYSNTIPSILPIPFTPPDSIRDVQKADNGNTPDLEIPPIKLSFSNLQFSYDEKSQLLEKGTVINSDIYWDRIGSKSRSIKKTLLLLTPTHSPSPSLTNDDLSGKVLTPSSNYGFGRDKDNEDFEKAYGVNNAQSCRIPFPQRNSSKNLLNKERNYANTLELPNPWNFQSQRSKSPVYSQLSASHLKGDQSSQIGNSNSISISDACQSNNFSATSSSSYSSNLGSITIPNYETKRSGSQSQLVLLSDDYAVRLSRNLSMSEVVYQTESLHNSLLPPPAHEENVLKLQKRGRQRLREDRSIIDGRTNFPTLQLKIPQSNERSEGFFQGMSFNTDFEGLLDGFFEFCDFFRQLLMTPIMFILYLTVPSPSLRRSVQIMQPLFIVLAVGFEKKIYVSYPLFYLIALLLSSIISLVLFFIYTCILNTRKDDQTSEDDLKDDPQNYRLYRVRSFSNIKLPEVQLSFKTRKFITDILMYCDMFFGIIMSIYWNGVLVNELVECIKVIGLTLGIKPAILGLTIVAMGNSIADLFANVAVSRAGHAHMGLAGCYGACVFLLLFGFGSSVFVRAIQLGFSKDIHLHFESQIITATYQLLYFLPISALVVVLSKGRVHRIWGLAFILYFIVCMSYVLKGVI
ncbi:Sodium/calcium exchanger protein [Cryptosporidium hominis]|uniref:Sodium/calcium exchanger protein n=1 Tax=Cryptosporidium hominis TaxID=237895 RepID=A0ABX5BBG4_CRYHO|nr:cation exchanger (CAX11) [Cryptosporidium hominis TU502]PPS93737.1 Sodium/calcium exchanger protein [Cryptosporidium hominis]|eukprot:PPS93737.1 Sodium/calcium exchanger protein [Cryptosporidium hominis]